MLTKNYITKGKSIQLKKNMESNYRLEFVE